MEERLKTKLKYLIKEKLRDLYWEFYGNNTVKNPELPDSPKSFIFVCKGNICRSPFAERLAIKIAKNKDFNKITVYSAGLVVSRSSPPPEEAILAAESFGVYLTGHKSRKVTDGIVESVDMIFAMETRHLNALRKYFPQFHDKIFLFPLFEKNSTNMRGNFYLYNILDPYGQSLDQFIECFQRIERCLYGLFEKIGFEMHI